MNSMKFILPHIYDAHMMEQYKGAPFGELSPHVFAVVDVSYSWGFFVFCANVISPMVALKYENFNGMMEKFKVMSIMAKAAESVVYLTSQALFGQFSSPGVAVEPGTIDVENASPTKKKKENAVKRI